MGKIKLVLSKDVYSPLELLEGLVIVQASDRLLELKTLSLRFVSKVIVNKAFFSEDALFRLTEGRRENIICATETTPFSAGKVLLEGETVVFYFSLQLPKPLPNSIRSKMVKFVNAIEVYREDKAAVSVYRVPFKVVAASFNSIEKLLYGNKTIFVCSNELCTLNKKSTATKLETLLNDFWTKKTKSWSVLAAADREPKLFHVLADTQLLATVEILRRKFFLNRPAQFVVRAVQPCKMEAKLFCVHRLGEAFLSPNTDQLFAEIKELHCEKVFDLSVIDTLAVDLWPHGDCLPSSENDLLSVSWFVHFAFFIKENFTEKKYVFECRFAMVRPKEVHSTITFDYILAS